MAVVTLHGNSLAEEGLTGAAKHRAQNTSRQGLQLEIENSFEHIYITNYNYYNI
jgi:hypothetical protein